MFRDEDSSLGPFAAPFNMAQRVHMKILFRISKRSRPDTF